MGLPPAFKLCGRRRRGTCTCTSTSTSTFKLGYKPRLELTCGSRRRGTCTSCWRPELAISKLQTVGTLSQSLLSPATGGFLQIELLLALLCDAIKMKIISWYYLYTCCQWPTPPWHLLLHKTLPQLQDKLKHTSRCPPTLPQCCEITYLVGYWLSFERAS